MASQTANQKVSVESRWWFLLEHVLLCVYCIYVLYVLYCMYWVTGCLSKCTGLIYRNTEWDLRETVTFLCALWQLCLKLFTAKELFRRADSSKCPVAKRNGSQWVQYGDHCYSAEQALYSFSEAKQLCQELGKLKFTCFLLNNLALQNFFLKKIKGEIAIA